MPKAMSYKKISKLLTGNGFYIKRQTGSHVIYKKNGKNVIVPKHGSKNIPGPTINSILKQSGLK